MAKANTKTKVVETEKKVVARTAFKISEEPYEVMIPDGFDFKVHKVLKKKNFKDDAMYYDHVAAGLDWKAKLFRSKAEECRKLGSPAERAKKRQMIRLNEKMEELKAQLTEQGIDVKALLEAATESSS